MPIDPIRDDRDHEKALARIEALWGAALDTPEGAELDALATLVEAYEAKRWPTDALDPIDALKTAMAEAGHSQSDLAALLGSRSRASEILARKRPLTLAMIRTIAAAWGVPPALLVGEYPLAEVG